VGLPRAGKTTLFNALTHAGAKAHEAKAHVGMAQIADERLVQVAQVEGADKATLAQIRIEDVPGAGPALLGNLPQAHALPPVLGACSPGPDPAGDLQQLRLELLVADSEHVATRLERVRTEAKSGDPKPRAEAAELEALLAHVEAGGAIADFGGAVPDALEPLTTKPLVTVENGPGGIDGLLELELAELPEGEAAELRGGPGGLGEGAGR